MFIGLRFEEQGKKNILCFGIAITFHFLSFAILISGFFFFNFNFKFISIYLIIVLIFTLTNSLRRIRGGLTYIVSCWWLCLCIVDDYVLWFHLQNIFVHLYQVILITKRNYFIYLFIILNYTSILPQICF